MFKKLIQSLSRSQAAVRTTPAAPSSNGPRGGALNRVTKQSALEEPRLPQTPEGLCGVTADMKPEHIKARLKLLYRRFNRGASSLNPKVRAEAEKMLDAIVTVRERYFGTI